MKLSLIIAFCSVFIVAGTAQADEMTIKHQTFSGASHETMVDTNGDFAFAAVMNLESKGGLGQSTSTHMTEYTAYTFSDCPDGVPTAHLVQHSYVQTFNDLSMLYGVATAGRICFDPNTSELTCEEEGIFDGGTGRFEGATGSWTVNCEIFLVGETMTALTGTLDGTVSVPHKKADD